MSLSSSSSTNMKSKNKKVIEQELRMDWMHATISCAKQLEVALDAFIHHLPGASLGPMKHFRSKLAEFNNWYKIISIQKLGPDKYRDVEDAFIDSSALLHYAAFAGKNCPEHAKEILRAMAKSDFFVEESINLLQGFMTEENKIEAFISVANQMYPNLPPLSGRSTIKQLVERIAKRAEVRTKHIGREVTTEQAAEEITPKP